MEKPIALYIAIYEIPYHRKSHNDDRHLAITLQQEWEDKGALEIVELEYQEEYQIRQLELDF
jgi:hypothetical protein